MNIMTRYEEILRELFSNDERYVIMTAENRAALRNLPAHIPQRFVDVGICEQTMIGMAAGMASRGRVPIVHALAAFLCMRAYEFIRTDVGIAGLPVKLMGGVAGVLSEANGPTHQALEDIALMSGIPGMGVFCPADEDDLLIGLPHILASPQPFYVRMTNQARVVRHSTQFQIGAAEQFGEHGDISILCYGALVKQAFAAAEILSSKGIHVSILNLRCLKPIDEEALLIASQRASLVVCLEDHFLRGGLYTMLCEILVRHQAQAHVLPIGFHERWFKPALLSEVLRYEGLDGASIARRIEEYVDNYRTQESWQIQYN